MGDFSTFAQLLLAFNEPTTVPGVRNIDNVSVRVTVVDTELQYRVYSSGNMAMLVDIAPYTLWFCDCDPATVSAILDTDT